MDNGHPAWTDRFADAASPTGWLTASAAAAALGVSQRTIRRAIARGDLPAVKLAGVYRIALADLAAFEAVRSHAVPPVSATPPGPVLVPFPARHSVVPAALPTWRTPLIGREDEVAALVDLLGARGASLVTLRGPGGVGKSRLAVRAATDLVPAFADGVRFVALASIRDPSFVATTILLALGAAERPHRPPVETLAEIIGDKRILLVLDNLEHLLAAAPLVAALLAACPRLAVLTTSRARLNLSGEHEFPVRPLPVPDVRTGEDGLSLRSDAAADAADSAAVRLFVARAQAIDPAFRLTEENAGAVASVCAAVDGLPLAIELAAAQTRLFSPRALVARMDRRLPYLTGGPRDHPDRHRTMAGAIAWSHDLLGERERTLFQGLAVFVGGFSLDAAEAVAGSSGAETRSGLAELVDHGVLGRSDGPGGEPRFVMLETIREFALERLAEGGAEGEYRRRHAAYVLDLAEGAAPALLGPDQVAWLDVLEAELANIRAALAWLDDAGEAGEAGQTEHGQRLAAALWTFWVVRDRVPEGRTWLEIFLEKGAAVGPSRTMALVASGDLAERQGNYDAAAVRLDEALALARATGHRAGEIAALRIRASVATSLGEAARARMADPAKAKEEVARAEQFLEQSLALAREAGDAWGMAKATHLLGFIPQERGELATAMAMFEEAIEEFRRLGDDRQVCMIAGNIGGAAVGAGDYERARAALAESLGLAKRLGYHWWIGICLNELGHIAARTGDHARAARLLGAARGLRDAAGAPLRAGPQLAQNSTIADITTVLGADATAEALRHGAALSLAAAVAEAEFVCAASHVPSPPSGDHDLDATAAMADLTPRERDVLRFLAEGKTDREIAEALFVGARTVRSHVASILAKLDAPTRTAAATIAVRRGLV